MLYSERTCRQSQLIAWRDRDLERSIIFFYRGKRYLAHKVPNMTLNCQLTVKFREQWFRWRGTLFGMVFMLVRNSNERPC